MKELGRERCISITMRIHVDSSFVADDLLSKSDSGIGCYCVGSTIVVS